MVGPVGRRSRGEYFGSVHSKGCENHDSERAAGSASYRLDESHNEVRSVWPEETVGLRPSLALRAAPATTSLFRCDIVQDQKAAQMLRARVWWRRSRRL